MKYVKSIIGALLFFVIGIVQLPITGIVALSVSMEHVFMLLMRKSVELANIPSLTESYNRSISFNSYQTMKLSDMYEDLKIDEESEEEDLGES